jgi:hypothetical protein
MTDRLIVRRGYKFALAIIQSRRSGCAIVLFLATRYFRVGFDNYRFQFTDKIL